MTQKAFTLTEIVVSVAVLSIVAAIAYPVLANAKKSAAKAECLSNMHQLSLALALYRSDHAGASTGSWQSMGMPVGSGLDDLLNPLFSKRCKGELPLRERAGAPPYLYFSWYVSKPKTWSELTNLVGEQVVIVGDVGHNPRSEIHWSRWRKVGLGARLDGSAFTRIRPGDIGQLLQPQWWYDEFPDVQE